MFCLGCCLAFSWSFGKFQTSIAHERLAYKKRVDSKLKDQSSFLANKTVGDFLELYVKKILFRIIHARNQITKLFIEPCPLSRKVYTEHYISKFLPVMHGLRIE